jgi:hypothetical protein
MDFLGKMVRLKEVGDPVKGVVIDKDCTKQSLLRLDIVRRQPERGIWAGAA